MSWLEVIWVFWKYLSFDILFFRGLVHQKNVFDGNNAMTVGFRCICICTCIFRAQTMQSLLGFGGICICIFRAQTMQWPLGFGASWGSASGSISFSRGELPSRPFFRWGFVSFELIDLYWIHTLSISIILLGMIHVTNNSTGAKKKRDDEIRRNQGLWRPPSNLGQSQVSHTSGWCSQGLLVLNHVCIRQEHLAIWDIVGQQLIETLIWRPCLL